MRVEGFTGSPENNFTSPDNTRTEESYRHGFTDMSALAVYGTSLAKAETNPAPNTYTSPSTDPEAGAEAERNAEVFGVSRNPKTYEVEVVSDITLEDWESVTRPDDWALLKKSAERVSGINAVFINSTLTGGGVAMLRPPLVHMGDQLGVKLHWGVMEPPRKPKNTINPEHVYAFDHTKRMHNIAQRQAGNARITEAGKAEQEHWSGVNAEVMTKQDYILKAHIIVIDDPQPAALIKYIKAVNPNVKIIWRNHIDTSGELMADPTTPQGEVASYILDECGVINADAVVTHTVKEFANRRMEHKTYMAPATFELFDDLNRILTAEERVAGINDINGQIDEKNIELSRLAVKNAGLGLESHPEDVQSHIDTTRRRIVLVARFDESKGMDKAMELGVQTRRKMRECGVPEENLPQIIIIGNGSVDDTSGIPMYEKILKLRREKYPDEMKDIIVMRLKHNYAAMNAVMYPTASPDEADPAPVIGIQTSDAEGCETRISDWIRHGVPVVVAKIGGMPDQVTEGKSGTLLDYSKPDFDLEYGASYISELMLDVQKYSAMRKSTLQTAENFNNRDYTTVANTIRWLRIFRNVLDGTPADKLWKLDDLHANELALAA